MTDVTRLGTSGGPRYAMPRWHELGPVHWDESGQCWIVTRYVDVKQVLTDPRFGQREAVVDSPSSVAPVDVGPRSLSQELNHQQALWMALRNPPDHTRLRVVLTPFFDQAAVDRLRPYIQAQAEQLLDCVLPAGEMDVVGDFADHLPFAVACEVLGVPEADRPGIKLWLRDSVSAMGECDSSTFQARGALANLALMSYFRRLATARSRNPGVDLLSTLVAEPSLTRDELAANAIMLLVAGVLNVRTMIPSSVLVLLRHPDKLRWLRRHPSRLGTALEELLRYGMSVHVRRVALADVELGSRTIRRGELLIVSAGAANRDPEEFEHPDRLDLTRRPNRHLSFVAGTHSCLGMRLARAELNIALGTLLRRVANLALVPGPLAWDELSVWRGLKALRVSIGASPHV